VRQRLSSSLMVPSRASPSVLTLVLPGRALSRVCFISPCPPLTPLPLMCTGSRLSRLWSPRTCRNGRRPSSSPMVRLPSSSTCDACNLQGRQRAPTSVTIAGAISSATLDRLQHLWVLLLRSHRVVEILPVGDLSDTIHPFFSSHHNCKGVQ
jgi:hypothetical protein